MNAEKNQSDAFPSMIIRVLFGIVCRLSLYFEVETVRTYNIWMYRSLHRGLYIPVVYNIKRYFFFVFLHWPIGRVRENWCDSSLIGWNREGDMHRQTHLSRSIFQLNSPCLGSHLRQKGTLSLVELSDDNQVIVSINISLTYFHPWLH